MGGSGAQFDRRSYAHIDVNGDMVQERTPDTNICSGSPIDERMFGLLFTIAQWERMFGIVPSDTAITIGDTRPNR